MLDTFTITGTSPAAPGTAVVGVPVAGLNKFESLKIYAALVGATGGTLDVYLQWTPDNGTTWIDFAHFPQLASGATAVKYNCDSRFGATTPTVVGAGTSPALAANTCVGGHFGTGLRCLAVAGSGTTAGAAVTIVLYGDRK